MGVKKYSYAGIRYLASLCTKGHNCTSIIDASKQQGAANVQVNGWIRNIRRHKNVTFIDLNDGTTAEDLQVVVKSDMAKEAHFGASARVVGHIKDSGRSDQKVELVAESLHLLGSCASDYPIQNQNMPADVLRLLPHLRPRADRFATLLRLKSCLFNSFRSVLLKKGFSEIQTPIISFNDCEGASQVFELADGLDFFGRKAFLTVSGQLHLEAAASSLGRVFTLGPVFRAEEHNTSRHLAEFSMLEVEISFIDDLQDLLNLSETLIKEGAKGLLSQSSPSDQKHLDQLQIKCLLEQDFARMTYTEALSHINEKSGLPPLPWGKSLGIEHERFLAEVYARGPIFVTDYPAITKAFYMKSNLSAIPDQKKWQGSSVSCFDLLLPKVFEATGGSLREDRLEMLEKSLDFFSLSKLDYRWYIDLRRYGTAPHGGFGVGLDRILQFMTGTPNIRDVVMIPRFKGYKLC